MEQELRDFLGLPGEVVLIENKTKQEIIEEIEGILDFYWLSLNNPRLKDIPEGPMKDRLRKLLSMIGFNVRF